MTSQDRLAFGPRKSVVFLACAIAVAAFVLAISMVYGPHFTIFQHRDQDRLVLLGLIGLLAALHFMPPLRLRPIEWPRRRVLVAALAVTALVLWGLTHALMRDFGVSFDEFMVLFDMQVYAQGRLAEPLPPEWRAYAVNLVPTLLFNSVNPDGMVSGYLPMNAIVRLGFSQVLPAALMNPALFLIGGVALLDIAKDQFGKDSETILVVSLLYALSMQALAAATTPYAMTAHLALNLVWLAAFLRGGRWHIVALATGAVAIGLHQILFHPLFVAPFLLQRLLRREWRLVAGYATAYAVICAAWVAFPMIVSNYTGSAPGAGHGDFLRGRVWPLITDRDPDTVMLMVMNVLRFFAWQHMALLPLVALSVAAVRRREGLTGPLLGGILLTLVVVAFLLPFQGHSLGYRYLHGWIGSFALLGGFGYRELRNIAADQAPSTVAIATLATLLAIGWLAYRIDAFVAPHVALERRLAAIDADMVLIETESWTRTLDGRWAANAIDLVRNRPDLANRPLRFSSQLMTPDRAAQLCGRGTIAMIDRAAQKRAGFSLNQLDPSARFASLRERLENEAKAGRCRIVG